MKEKSIREHNKVDDFQETAPRKRLNWPIIAGIFIISIISVIAVIGPDIAPKDPNEEHNITMIEGEWYIPPFNIGTPGYPLGSDSFGRDLYSRLLWGIQPTMIMVLIVAFVRLIIGVVIGLAAGWFTGKTGRFLNSLIQISLALPVLLVALGAIAIVGVELGIWAFIIGLSLTGWVDTALQVREQTKIVKGQVYIEAANALGATNQQILSNHILKQITPMLLMLFAFEISSTLMLTAGLGFLGYYIGGDVWVDVDDFVARRISGNPELGQMLATSWVTLTKPWAMVAVGTTVFLTVLGFNLIGEGLRQNIGFAIVQKRTAFADARTNFALWFNEHLWHPALQFIRIRSLRYGFAVIGTLFVLGFGALLLLDAAAQSDVSSIINYYPQEENSTQEIQATMVGTAQNSQDSGISEIEIIYNPEIVWESYDENGFSGGLTLSPTQDKFYYMSNAGTVYAADLDGNLILQTEIPNGGKGEPAIDEDGNLLVADPTGGLSKLSPQGELLWQFQSTSGDRSHSGPAIGKDGTIYYTVGTSSKGFLQAVSPSGESIWVTQTKTPFFFEKPQPSADRDYVFLKDDIFLSGSGELLDFTFELDVLRFFSGDNGKNYLLAGRNIIEWKLEGTELVVVDMIEWDTSSFSNVTAPAQVGVNAQGESWQLYTTPGGHTSVVWVSQDDRFLGISTFPKSASILVSVEDDLSALVCGGGAFYTISTDCGLLGPEFEDPIWSLHLGDFGPVLGGFALNGHYYVSTEEGYVIKLDENQETVLAAGAETQLPEGVLPEEIGIQWAYQTNFEDGAVINLEKNSEGLIFIFTGDEKIHILDPNGEVLNVIQLPASLYYEVSTTGRSAPLQIHPEILPDGTIILISEDLAVYGMDTDGNILWEDTLNADPAEPSLMDESGTLYIIDINGGLNAINKDGLKWRFQSEAADMPAHGFTLGSNGNIYYVVTNYSKGYIQAVSNEGENLWATQTTTRDFYDGLNISSDGSFISLAENLLQTNDGMIVEYSPADIIDEYIFSSNGQNFLRSTHTVREWRLGASGIEILNEGLVSEENTTLRPPLGSMADSNGIVWLFYPEKYTGGGTIIVWMSPNGEIIGRHLLERNFQNITSIDSEKSQLTKCTEFESEQTMECKTYSAKSGELIWEVFLKDIPHYYGGKIIDNFLYLYAEDNSIYELFIGEPPSE